MYTLLAAMFALVVANIQAFPAEKRFIPGPYSYADDTNGIIQYIGSWVHGNTSLPLAYMGTLSYSNDPNAIYSFTVYEDSFDFAIYSGRKADRGYFLVDVDGFGVGTGAYTFAGAQRGSPKQSTGDQYDFSQTTDGPTVQLIAGSVSGSGPHTVSVHNSFDDRLGKVPFLAVDFIEITDRG